MTEKQKGEAEYGIWNEDCSFCRRAEKAGVSPTATAVFPNKEVGCLLLLHPFHRHRLQTVF